MKIENQVCTLEQAKRLKELGIRQKSIFYYHDKIKRIDERIKPNWGNSEFAGVQICNQKSLTQSAYTVAELGVMLPDEIPHRHTEHSDYYYMQSFSDVLSEGDAGKSVCMWYEDNDLDAELEVLNNYYICGKTEAEARAAMLIYMLENNLTTAEEVNNRLNS